MKETLNFRNIFYYSLLAIPLSFISLPLYVNVPKYYLDLGLELSQLSLAIIIIRILDAFFDPLFGIIFKKFSGKRLLICLIFSPVIAFSFYILFNPFTNHILLNLISSLVITSLATSVISINYESYAAEIGQTKEERAKIISIRESFQIIGIIFATALPAFIGYQKFSLISAIIIILFAAIAYFKAKETSKHISIENNKNLKELFLCFKDKLFQNLIIVHILNSIASSIPAVMFLFFVSQVLKVNGFGAGLFLFTYFTSAFISMPFWYFLSKKYNKKTSWQISILLAIITFVWAFSLNSNNYELFYVVCFLSGFASGGDLIMPTAILSDIAHKNINKTSQYFGIWGFLAKLNFALATLLSFSLLNLFSSFNMYLSGISFIYALLPCLLKIPALIYLTLKFKENL